MKPDIYLDASLPATPEIIHTHEMMQKHSLFQVGFICASLLLSGGWTDPNKVYVPCGAGYAICDIHVPVVAKSA